MSNCRRDVSSSGGTLGREILRKLYSGHKRHLDQLTRLKLNSKIYASLNLLRLLWLSVPNILAAVCVCVFHLPSSGLCRNNLPLTVCVCRYTSWWGTWGPYLTVLIIVIWFSAAYLHNKLNLQSADRIYFYWQKLRNILRWLNFRLTYHFLNHCA